MSKMTQLTTLAAASLLGLWATQAAMASTEPTVSSKVVNLRGLDLGNEADARIALGRITRAAEHLCADEGATFPYKWSDNYRRCMHDAVGGAVTQSQSRHMATLFDGNRYNNREVAYAPLPPR